MDYAGAMKERKDLEYVEFLCGCLKRLLCNSFSREVVDVP